MNKLTPIAVIAASANALTVILYLYAAGEPGGSGTALVFAIIWMPILWVSCIVTVIVLAVVRRKALFNSIMLKLSLPTLLFCTPLPIWLVFNVTHYSSTYLASTGYNPHDGYTVKDEEWYYTTNQKPAVHKYFKLATENYEGVSDSLFKRDSVWSYLNLKGDTVKIERYGNGKLISTTLQHEGK